VCIRGHPRLEKSERSHRFPRGVSGMTAPPAIARALALGRRPRWLLAFCAVWVGALGLTVRAARAALARRLTGVKGEVRFTPATDTTRTTQLQPGATNHFISGDQLTTGPRSGANLDLRSGMSVEIHQLTIVRFKDKEDGAGIRLLRGIAAFFNRDRAGRYDVDAGTVNMVIRAPSSPSRSATTTPPCSPSSTARSRCARPTARTTHSSAAPWLPRARANARREPRS